MSGRGDRTREALRSALSKDARVHAWQIRSVRQSDRQSYLVRTQLEAERTVASETHDVTVFVRHGDLLGRAAVTIGPGEGGGLPKRIDEAVFMAGLGGDAPWALPAAGERPRVEAFDPALAGERVGATADALVDQWRAAVSGLEGVKPSSMELFCRSAQVTFQNSAGFEAHWSETRVSLLSILLASGDGRVSERESWEERRRVSDLDVGAIVTQAAEEARDLTRASVPPSGSYPVLIDADEIRALLAPVRGNASAERLYQKTSRFEVSKPLPIEGATGEPLTLISNAIAPYGLSSYAFDDDGVPGCRVEIVKDGVFTRPWATKQFADYLGIEPTGAFANLEIPSGRTPLADLRAGDGPILHVGSFSWLNPDEGRGNFSSEIRVGHLYENGARRPVKGGSVSGNVFKALGNARYARDVVSRRSYLGPAAVRIEGLSIAGA